MSGKTRVMSSTNTKDQVLALCDPKRQEMARAYNRRMRAAHLVTLVAQLAYFAVWLLPGGRAWLGRWTASLPGGWPVQVAAAFLALGIGYWVLDTALAVPRYLWARRFGQSTQSWHGWITDRVKGGVLAGLLGLVMVEVLFGLVATGQAAWWLWAALLLVALQALLTFVAPVLIAPLFFRLTPLDDDALRERFLRLAREVGVPAVGVYRFDMSRRTRAANAAVVGLGHTRRIVIADTLLESFTPDEAEVVLAHELAHHVHRDTQWGLLVNGLVLLVGMRILAEVWPALAAAWDTSAVDPRLLPAVLLFFEGYTLLTAPLVNLWSRGRETLADIFAVAVTGKGRTYARALARLADQNLAELWPPRWYTWLFGTHPPLGERVELALALDREEAPSGRS